MNWRTQLTQQSDNGHLLVGRFRNARFVVPGSNAKVGRRVQVHEYPLRDTPYVEDLGRSAREFAVDVFVDASLGNYLQARDALIAALEAHGPGTLVHPWYGRMQVALSQPAQVRESSKQGGRAQFNLVFVEAGELTFPAANTDTQAVAQAASNKVLEQARATFAAEFDVGGLPGWAITDAEKGLRDALSEVESLVGNVTDGIATLIRTPANMAAAITGSVARLRERASTPLAALRLYKVMFDAGSHTVIPKAHTPLRQQQAVSMVAQRLLVRLAAVTQACRSAAMVHYDSRDEALRVANLLSQALDAQMEWVNPVTQQPLSDALYDALRDLHAAVTTDLRQRGARLPEVRTYTPTTTLPALVLAWHLYADNSRSGELAARNQLRRPGFVPGGQPLEVLDA